MAFFYGKCGTQLKKQSKILPRCGANVRLRSAPVSAIQLRETPGQRMASFQLPALNDVEQRKVMATLAYFSILY